MVHLDPCWAAPSRREMGHPRCHPCRQIPVRVRITARGETESGSSFPWILHCYLFVFTQLYFYLILWGIFFFFFAIFLSFCTVFLMGQIGSTISGKTGFSVLLIDGLIFIEHSTLPAEPKLQVRIPALGIYVLMKRMTDNTCSPPPSFFLLWISPPISLS